MERISGVLTGAENWIEVSLMDTDDIYYLGFDGKTVAHSCEQMMNGYEAEFCGDELYFIQAGEINEKLSHPYMGFTYSCDVHLLDSCLKFIVDLSKRYLDAEFDRWTDRQSNMEKQLNYLTRCSVCGGEGEHDWEVHVAEMRANS